jgi:excisionase family DNA binding protein
MSICVHVWPQGSALASQPVIMKRMDTNKTYLTIHEAAKICGLSAKTLRRWISRRELPYFQPGRSILIKLEDLIAHVEAYRVDAIYFDESAWA